MPTYSRKGDTIFINHMENKLANVNAQNLEKWNINASAKYFFKIWNASYLMSKKFK